MARVNVYLPDDLADDARSAGLNVSGLTQEAVRRALEARRTDAWLSVVGTQRPAGVRHQAAAAAVAAAKDDFDHDE